ncbi:MAG TPA: histone deacetylase, partial [Deltaproteobacteria bacterium]|nr:histone deacetylase [Deltaproteobacteria bacterium]
DWKRSGLPIKITHFDPLTTDQIALAHDATYVQGVLNCLIENGFQNKSRSIAASLPYTIGSMAAAALHAYRMQEGVTVSPTSGFHHAGYDPREGGLGSYCTFNGLVIAARLALHDGTKKVGICDIDAHWGNGTDDILLRLGLADKISHYTFGGEERIAKIPTPYEGQSQKVEEWLGRLPTILDKMFTGVNLLLYQAGADPWIYDPHGGFLTKEQMARRDE